MRPRLFGSLASRHRVLARLCSLRLPFDGLLLIADEDSTLAVTLLIRAIIQGVDDRGRGENRILDLVRHRRLIVSHTLSATIVTVN